MTNKPKTKDQLIQELKIKKRKEFLEKCNDALKPLIDEYSMRLVPVIRNLSTEYKVHYEAAFAVQEFTKEEVKVQKGNTDKTNASLDTKSKINKGADSDN